jgi:probable DNA metabolism protein
MHHLVTGHPSDLEAWRVLAREALAREIPPDQIAWTHADEQSLLPTLPVPDRPSKPTVAVPGDLLALLSLLLAHSDPQRFALAYRLTWRVTRGERDLLARRTDDDVHRAYDMAKAVRRDLHKMKAFVRFRAIDDEGPRYVAWFEPTHFIVDRVAPFFLRRFTGMRWTILTPYRSVDWNGRVLQFGPGARRSDAAATDALEDLWRTYYAGIFNPARLNTRMMRQEMPQKYWKNLPEAHLLPTLIRDAGARVQAMVERSPQPPRRHVPEPVSVAVAVPPGSLAELNAAAAGCRACPLWGPATQTVVGEGPGDARIMVIGEQPGDEEDLAGRPFVGPAGRLFDKALAQVGIDRDSLYVTNAVKHFKFEQRGRWRLHKNPDRSERQSCRKWLAGEIERVQPDYFVCLGVTAAEAMLGRGVRLMTERGRWLALDDRTWLLLTVHPAFVLRQPDGPARARALTLFADDLALLGQLPGPARRR